MGVQAGRLAAALNVQIHTNRPSRASKGGELRQAEQEAGRSTEQVAGAV